MPRQCWALHLKAKVCACLPDAPQLHWQLAFLFLLFSAFTIVVVENNNISVTFLKSRKKITGILFFSSLNCRDCSLLFVVVRKSQDMEKK